MFKKIETAIVVAILSHFVAKFGWCEKELAFTCIYSVSAVITVIVCALLTKFKKNFKGNFKNRLYDAMQSGLDVAKEFLIFGALVIFTDCTYDVYIYYIVLCCLANSVDFEVVRDKKQTGNN